MQKLSKMESFENFQMTKKAMSQISGSRTKNFEEVGGECFKVIDDNNGNITKIKQKDRYEC